MALRPEGELLPRVCLAQWGEAFAFGPVVACAVMLDARAAAALADLSRAEWPRMTAAELNRAARRVSAVVPYEAVQLAPRKFNTLLAKVSGNRARVLNWSYKKALTAMLERYPACRAATFDVHAPAFAVLGTDVPREVAMVYRGADDLDPGLAAAGVLARAHYEKAFTELERTAGEALPREEDPAGVLARLLERGGGPLVLQMAKRDHPATQAVIAARSPSG